MTGKQKRIIIIVVLSVALVYAALYAAPRIIRYAEDVSGYRRALPYYESGRYEEAIELLYPDACGDNNRCKALLHLCHAAKAYRDGDIRNAHDEFFTYNFFRSQTAGVIDVNDTAFARELNEAYTELREEQKAAEAAAYERRIRNGVPFVGMPELRIDDTSLGAHADVRTSTVIKGSGRKEARIYVFKKNGDIIFEAYCLDRSVEEVWDYRDGTHSSPYSKKNRSKRSATAKPQDDPYNAGDFYDAEDFYEEYYDEFSDFEDAEDYFIEHQK